jgi:hypothetical protein
MGFNLKGAVGGLLSETGVQANKMADRMYSLEEKRLEQEGLDRRERAKIVREGALQAYGYTKSGIPVTKEEYEALPDNEDGTRPLLYDKALDREKPVKPKDAPDRRGTTGKEYDDLVKIYGEEKAKEILDENRAAKNREKSGKPEKPEVSEKEALKGIASATKALGDLRKGDKINTEDYKALVKDQPMLAMFLSDKKEMSQEDREKAVQSLEEYISYLEGFKPKSTRPSAQTGVISSPGSRPPLTSFESR